MAMISNKVSAVTEKDLFHRNICLLALHQQFVLQINDTVTVPFRSSGTTSESKTHCTTCSGPFERLPMMTTHSTFSSIGTVSLESSSNSLPTSKINKYAQLRHKSVNSLHNIIHNNPYTYLIVPNYCTPLLHAAMTRKLLVSWCTVTGKQKPRKPPDHFWLKTGEEWKLLQFIINIQNKRSYGKLPKRKV